MTMPLHIAPPGQYIVEPEANIEDEAKANASWRSKWQAYRMAITLVNRENKAKWLDQEWRDSQQDTTFRQGFMHQGEIKIRQVENTPGGIRYLPNFDFPMVQEALTEGGILLRIAALLSQPPGFVPTIYSRISIP